MPNLAPFIIWSLPGSSSFKTLSIGEGDDTFVFAPFNPQMEGIELKGNSEEINLDQLTIELPASKELPSSTEQLDHLRLVKKAIRDVTETPLEKIVVSTRTSVEGAINIVESLKALRSLHPNALVYYFFHPETGGWMGATPEHLVASEGEKYLTASLAGTRFHEENEVPWGQKESLEQSIVTDYIKQTLRDGGAEEIRISRPETFRFGDIEHIRSEIRFQSEDVLQIVKKLHPTPAVCGTPVAPALEWIENEESHDRTYYTGYLGTLDANRKAQLFVNLRCLEVFGNGIVVYAGGGITFDSEPEKEWEETRAKVKSIATAIKKI